MLFRAIEEHDAEKDVVEEMRKILLLLQGHEEPKTDNVKGSKGGGGRRSTTPDEKYVMSDYRVSHGVSIIFIFVA